VDTVEKHRSALVAGPPLELPPSGIVSQGHPAIEERWPRLVERS